MVNQVPFLQNRSRTHHVNHIVTKAISFYHFETRHFQPFLYPPLFGFLFSHFSQCAFPYDTWSVSLNCTSSFSDCRFPGKLNQLYFGALEEDCKEARQNELTFPADRRDHEENHSGIRYQPCELLRSFLCFTSATANHTVENNQIIPQVEESNTFEKIICSLPKCELERKGFLSSSGCLGKYAL